MKFHRHIHLGTRYFPQISRHSKSGLSFKHFAQENLQNLPKMFHKMCKNMQQKKPSETGKSALFFKYVRTHLNYKILSKLSKILRLRTTVRR